jgi:membrane fusion protein (multidrug efflux system)
MKKNNGKPIKLIVKEKTCALCTRIREIKPVKKICACVKKFFPWVWNHEKSVAARKEVKKSVQKVLAYLNKNEKTRKIVEKVSKIKFKRRTVIIFTMMIVLLIIVANFIFPLHKKLSAPERIVRCDVYAVKKVEFSDELFAMGLVRGERSIDIGFQVAGVVKRVYVTEGMPVAEGDLIAELDDTDARLKVEYNESKLKAAQEKLKVHRQLYDLRTIIKAKLDEVTYEYEAQAKELEFAKQELAKTKLTAAVTGVVGPLEVEAGELVSPHSKIASLFNLNKVYVDAGIIEKDISKIRRDEKVVVEVDAYPGDQREGKVFTISPVVEGKSRNFKIRIEIPNNDPSKPFLPGMFARSRIIIYSATQAFIVPVSAIKDDMVYLVKDSKITPQVVKIKYKSYDYAQVSEGLKEGDQIVAEVENEIASGTKAEVINKREYGK